jgi:predicted ArsR family transcriptional regulator
VFKQSGVDRLEGIGDAALRATLLFVRDRRGSVSADDVAREFRVHRNVARSRLERLRQAGLLEAAFERRSGRSGPGAGRPAKVYALVPEREALEFPPRQLDALVRRLMERLPPRGRPRALREVGAEYAAELADAARLRPQPNLRLAAEEVCAALGRLGFHGSLELATDERAVVRTATCPLRPLVVSAPEAQAIDCGMWAALTATALAEAGAGKVEATTAACGLHDSACRVELKLRP